MDDLYFEKELRNRVRIEQEKHLESRTTDIYFSSDNRISGTTEEVFGKFDYILDSYYYRKYGDKVDYEQIFKLVQKFKSNLTDEKLLSMYRAREFSEEEMDYIKLSESTSSWLHIPYCGGARHAVTDILLRDLIIREFAEDSIEIFKDIIETELPTSYRSTITHFKRLFSGRPYGENNHEKLEESIEKQTDYYFNQRINCGGYAMKIDQCIFPTQDNFSASVSYILDTLPFTRLLGDKPLEEDEYMVIYRAPEGKAMGHHFVRVDSDGTVREKDGISPIQTFDGWNNLETYPEAIFAVKKDHKMFGYKDNDINFRGESLDFEGAVARAFRDGFNIFSYHSHEFCLKKSGTGDIYVTTTIGEIIAEAIVDDNDCVVEILEGKSEYVENISNGVKPIIVDGKLVNFDKFKGAREVEER